MVAATLAARNLEWIAKWSIHQLFPGVKAEMGSFKVVSATRLEVRELRLKSSKTGKPLLALADGSVVFRFSDLLRFRLDEVRLQHPNLVVSPDLGDALGVKPSGFRAGSFGSAQNWGIGRLVVSNGHLRITRFGRQSPTVDLDFSTDLQNFGIGGEAGKLKHFTRLEKIIATDARDQPFLKIADADLQFTTEELFADERVRAVRIGEGSFTVTPSLINFFASPPKAAIAGSAGPEQSDWSTGSLQIDGVDVTIPNAPGVIGKVNFRIKAALQNLSAGGSSGAETEQRITLTNLSAATDDDPASTLLKAMKAEVRFSVAGLVSRRVEELLLEDPVIDLAPHTFIGKPTLGSTSPITPRGTNKPPAWLIGRVSCNYGTLRLRDLQEGALDVTAKFAFDLKNFGTLGDASTVAQEVTVWDVQADSGAAQAFATLDVVQLRFTLEGLLEQQHIEEVNIAGGRLLVGEALQKLLAAQPAQTTSASVPASNGWSIGALEIAGVRTRVEDKRPGLTELRFTLNTVLRNVKARGVSSQLLEEVQTVEFANIDLRSPLNSTAKILSLRSVFVRFTLRDLARKHLREVVILRPSIFLSQDLFVYMERASTPANTVPNANASIAKEPGWSVDHLQVKFGRLVIGSGGRSDVGLPLEFETTANNLELDNLAKLQLQTVLRVPKQSREFPDYQITVEDMEGDLRFAYPPEKGEKNLVQKLDVAAIRWRQYRAKQAWVAVTFDARGINGEFGGAAYRGYLNGGFSFFFGNDSPWIGWISGTGIDTQSLTSVISPQNFSLTGPLDFEIQLDAFRKKIDRVRGIFHLTEPGRMKIGKLDDVLANIPSNWAGIKQSSTRIALETLRDFDYTTASGDFWFVKSQGILNLDLNGPNGSRKFEVALHDDQETQNQWQQGKLGKE